jgi:hypothetical protein
MSRSTFLGAILGNPSAGVAFGITLPGAGVAFGMALGVAGASGVIGNTPGVAGVVGIICGASPDGGYITAPGPDGEAQGLVGPTAPPQSGVAQGAGAQQSLDLWQRARSRASSPGEELPHGSHDECPRPPMRLRRRDSRPGDEAHGSHGAAIGTGPTQPAHPAGSYPASDAEAINKKAAFIWGASERCPIGTRSRGPLRPKFASLGLSGRCQA